MRDEDDPFEDDEKGTPCPMCGDMGRTFVVNGPGDYETAPCPCKGLGPVHAWLKDKLEEAERQQRER